MLQYLRQAQVLFPSMLSPSSQQKEANWLLKVAWNLALQCQQNHREMADFFIICYELSSYLLVDVSMLKRQRSCQLMAAAACIQIARSANEREEKVFNCFPCPPIDIKADCIYVTTSFV